jgi:hypothetical protein
LHFIDVHPVFEELRFLEGSSLRARLELSEATHYLSDAGYRLFQGSDMNRASAVLLLGMKCLQSAFSSVTEDILNDEYI